MKTEFYSLVKQHVTLNVHVKINVVRSAHSTTICEYVQLSAAASKSLCVINVPDMLSDTYFQILLSYFMLHKV